MSERVLETVNDDAPLCPRASVRPMEHNNIPMVLVIGKFEARYEEITVQVAYFHCTECGQVLPASILPQS